MSGLNAQDLIREALAAGLELVPDGEHLTVRGDADEVQRLVPLLRQHKKELLRLLADPSAPCPACGSGGYWKDGDGWHCESCAPPPAGVTRWRNVSGGKLAPMPAPALPWPADLADALQRVSMHFEWTRADIADFCRWARRSPEALADAAEFLRTEYAKLPGQRLQFNPTEDAQ